MCGRTCFGCLKFLVFVINFLIWLFGLGVVTISLWLFFAEKSYLDQLNGADHADYYTGTYIFLIIGCIMTFVGFLGCCGAWKESTWMLGTFFTMIVVIFVGELVIGSLIYFRHAPYEDVLKRSVENVVYKKYFRNSTATSQAFDLIQTELHCCGVDGPKDWSKSAFNGVYERRTPEIGIPFQFQTNTGETELLEFDIPVSCCRNPDTQECLTSTRNTRKDSIREDQIYSEGCSDELLEFLKLHGIYSIAMASGIALIQLVGMCLSLCLCCTIRNIDDYNYKV